MLARIVSARPSTSRRASLYKISLIRVDLPDPETPVIQTSFPSGIETLMPFKLFADALTILSNLPFPSRLFFGTSICLRPERYCPVNDFGCAKICFGVPSAMTLPPCSPAAGPRSMTQSASRMVSSSCSTTRTVLPRSRSPLRVSKICICRADATRWRLIQHIQHPDQTRADLSCKPDPLRFTAR